MKKETQEFDSKTNICMMSFESVSQFDRLAQIRMQLSTGLITLEEAINAAYGV